MKIKNVLVSLVFFSYLKTSTSLNCYWNSGCPYKYFGSKTPYNFVRGDIRDSVIHLKGCEPVSIWGMYRHGKRQPCQAFSKMMKSALVIQNYVEASYISGKSSLCAEDIENLIHWEPEPKIFEDTGNIDKDGLKEMEEIGKRLKQAFPKLLGNLKEGSYIFQSAFGLRMEKSMEAFIKGLKDNKLTFVRIKDEYDFAAPYQTCKSYQEEFKNETKLYAEQIKYYTNPEFLVMKDRIQRRSGIEYILTNENVMAIFDLCRYHLSGFDNKLSPWCALLTADDLLVLEYNEDLRHYYRNGYGHPKAEMFGRAPLTDLLTKFKQAKEGNGKKIVAYVSHATMLDMMYTALGLYKDNETLTALHRDPGRKWRSAKHSSFSSNLMAVLNRCPGNKIGEYNVVFYVNEEPLMSICEQGVCTWQEFEQKLTFQNVSLNFCDGLVPPRLDLAAGEVRVAGFSTELITYEYTTVSVSVVKTHPILLDLLLLRGEKNPKSLAWSIVSKTMIISCKKVGNPESKDTNGLEKCYSDLGCVRLTPEWWHSKHRPVNVLPSERHAVNTIFLHWKLDNGTVHPEIITDLNVHSSLKVLIHDFTSNGYTGWIKHLSRALRSRRDTSEIVSVNWAAGAEPPYVQAVANARLVALEVTQFINKLKEKCKLVNKVHIIGHGLGAHIAGYVGKMIKPQRITALDPSGPYFMNMPPNVRLHKQDASLVEVVHTDNMPYGQGYTDIMGHVDFFPNGGKSQPGCVDSPIKIAAVTRDSLKLGETLSACSHKRGLKYYIESFIHPSCFFIAFSCPNFKDFMKGKCATCGDKMQYCTRMPVVAKRVPDLNNSHGFHLATSNSAPYCVEILKVLLVIKSKFSEQSFVKGYFNVTIPQVIGDVSFLINENHALNALNTDDHHVFLVFRTVPPPLMLPSEAVHIKWVQGPLPTPWSNPPMVTGFMIYKMTDTANK